MSRSSRFSVRSGDEVLTRDDHPARVVRVVREEGVDFAWITYLDGHLPGPVGGRVAGTEDAPIWEHRVRSGRVLRSGGDYYRDADWIIERGLRPLPDPDVAAARPRGRAGGSRPAPRGAAPSTSPQGGNMSTTTTDPAAAPVEDAKAEDAPKASAKKPAAPKVAEGVTVDALVAALRDAGVKPKVRWNPKRTYASLLVGKQNIGYVDAPTRNGMKVTPAVQLGDLKNGVKRAFAASGRAGRFGAVLMVVDEKGLGHAVAALVAADEKRQAPAAKEQA